MSRSNNPGLGDAHAPQRTLGRVTVSGSLRKPASARQSRRNGPPIPEEPRQTRIPGKARVQVSRGARPHAPPGPDTSGPDDAKEQGGGKAGLAMKREEVFFPFSSGPDAGSEPGPAETYGPESREGGGALEPRRPSRVLVKRAIATVRDGCQAQLEPAGAEPLVRLGASPPGPSPKPRASRPSLSSESVVWPGVLGRPVRVTYLEGS